MTAEVVCLLHLLPIVMDALTEAVAYTRELASKRQHPRVVCEVPAHVTLHGYAATKVLCTNVSETGAGLSGAASLPLGTIVYFSLPLEGGKVMALAEVVRTSEDEDVAGVRFISVSAGSVRLLSDYVSARLYHNHL